MMFVHRELQTNAENSNQDDDGTINLIKTRNTWKDIHIICWIFDSNSNLYFLAFLLLIVTTFTNWLSFRTQIHKCWIKKYRYNTSHLTDLKMLKILNFLKLGRRRLGWFWLTDKLFVLVQFDIWKCLLLIWDNSLLMHLPCQQTDHFALKRYDNQNLTFFEFFLVNLPQ